MIDFYQEISDKVSKVIWYVRDPDLPRRKAVSYLNFSIHCEILYHDKTYESLLKFCKEFNSLTDKKIAVCISNPMCPFVKDAMREKRFPEDKFKRRVLEISGIADIGYHGHFYRKEPGGKLVRISHNNYDRTIVKNQITEEIKWFYDIGIYSKIYTAGWWFLKKEIVRELERLGIEIDLSIRKDKSDSFGGHYLENDEIPDSGKPFILPPSKTILEIHSIFGPVMVTPIMKWHLSRYLGKYKKENLFLLFHLHDWDVLNHYHNVWANIKELCGFKDIISWENVLDMRELYFAKRARNGPNQL